MSAPGPTPRRHDPEMTHGPASDDAGQRAHRPARNAESPAAANERKPPHPADETGLDQAQRDERQSPRPGHRDGRSVRPGLGGSNRLLTPADVADWLGVPTKTIYARWRQWGLRAYKVGRHLRFRQRHIEDWLESQETPWQ